MSDHAKGPLQVSELLRSRMAMMDYSPPTTGEVGRIEHTDIEVMHFTLLCGAGARFKLKTLDLAILCCIWTFSKKKGHCYMSKQRMASLVRTNEVSLYQHLGSLKRKGLIETVEGKGRVKLLRLSAEAQDYLEHTESEISRRRESNGKRGKNKNV